jgi:hypothetical protein
VSEPIHVWFDHPKSFGVFRAWAGGFHEPELMLTDTSMATQGPAPLWDWRLGVAAEIAAANRDLIPGWMR